MKAKIVTTLLLVLCGLGIGWLAYENLMWAVWGKQNHWFEYVGFYGCPIMVVAGFIALKNLRLGSLVGCVGFILTLFYLGPALINTLHAISNGNQELKAPQIVLLTLIIGVPILTLLMLIWNVSHKRHKMHKIFFVLFVAIIF